MDDKLIFLPTLASEKLPSVAFGFMHYTIVVIQGYTMNDRININPTTKSRRYILGISKFEEKV